MTKKRKLSRIVFRAIDFDLIVILQFILLISAVTVSITSGSASRAQIQIPKRVASGDDIVIKCHIDFPSESGTSFTGKNYCSQGCCKKLKCKQRPINFLK